MLTDRERAALERMQETVQVGRSDFWDHYPWQGPGWHILSGHTRQRGTYGCWWGACAWLQGPPEERMVVARSDFVLGFIPNACPDCHRVLEVTR